MAEEAVTEKEGQLVEPSDSEIFSGNVESEPDLVESDEEDVESRRQNLGINVDRHNFEPREVDED